MRYVSYLATVLFVIALPVLLVTSNIRYLLGDVAFYERGMRKYDAVEATGISQEELDRSAAEIVRYFEDDAETLLVIVVEDGEEVSLFNTRETTHMEDVKRLVRFVFRLNELSMGFVIIYVAAVVLWSRERSMRRLAVETLAAIGLAFAALMSVGFFFLFFFDATWDKFHEIVFPNDLWRLNPDTDHMIQMFPEKFWEEATFIAGGLSLAEFALLVVLATGYLAIARPPRLVSAPATDGPAELQAEDAPSNPSEPEADEGQTGDQGLQAELSGGEAGDTVRNEYEEQAGGDRRPGADSDTDGIRSSDDTEGGSA